MAERVKKRSEIREQDTWKLEDMIASPEKFEELADGVEERIPGYETYRGKLGSSADLLKSYLEFDESMDETISLLYAYAMQKHSSHLPEWKALQDPAAGRRSHGSRQPGNHAVYKR